MNYRKRVSAVNNPERRRWLALGALALLNHGLRGWAFRHRGLSPEHAG